jgi:hypothetical protein
MLNKLKILIYYQFNNWFIYIWRSSTMTSNLSWSPKYQESHKWFDLTFYD